MPDTALPHCVHGFVTSNKITVNAPILGADKKILIALLPSQKKFGRGRFHEIDAHPFRSHPHRHLWLHLLAACDVDAMKHIRDAEEIREAQESAAMVVAFMLAMFTIGLAAILVYRALVT